MKKHIKAALYSGLVFPGTGHIYLKKYVEGLVIILIALAAVGFMVAIAVDSALKSVDYMQILNHPDAGNISNIVSPSMENTSAWYEISKWVLIICWLFAIIDAYRIGKRDNMSEKKTTDELKS